jgi:hemoglobin/transferrin/lactoferrin receptor protein
MPSRRSWKLPLFVPWMILGLALPVHAIEEILVVGARLPRPVQDVVGTVDVVTREDLLRSVAVQLDDVVRYTPGVSVARADNRFGATELTIRGLSGNRVTTLIDGVPVSDQFDIGAFSNAGQDYLVADALSRVEILRGPASTLFGSDALGGVVALISRDPEEYLDGRRAAAWVSTSYSGADRAKVVNGALAGRSGALSGVLHLSTLRGSELDAAGTSAEDPLNRRRDAAKLKLAYAFPGGNVLRLNGQLFDETVDSRPEAVLGFGRQFANTTALEGDDRRRRASLQAELDFHVAGAWAESGRVNLYRQRSRIDQVTRERRDLLTPPLAIRRSFDYRADETGAILDLDSRMSMAGTDHRLGWGIAVRRSRIEELRDGVQTDLLTGTTTRVLLGEAMPVRDFPNSTVTEVGVYLHDEIDLGPVTVIPGLRGELYRLDARADALFREDNPDTRVVNVDEWALAPKLAVQWRVADGVDLVAQYARGFRAPPFEDVNIGLDIPLFNVRAIPNPELRSETSDGVEIGVRYRSDRLRASAMLFGADYDDFIESKVPLGPDPETGVLLFQSRNIDRARVYGVDLSLAVQLSDDVSLDAAASWTRGEDRDGGTPLNTVDPPSAVMRLDWQATRAWGAGVAATAVAKQSRVDERAGELFTPGGFVTIDLMARYTPGELIRVNAGVFNVTDRRYWRWGSVRGRPEGDPLIDVLAAPGRYAAVSLQVRL